MTNVTPFTPRQLYEAGTFTAHTAFGEFAASGTLCGHIDFVGPYSGCFPLSPDEALAIIVMLQGARADVLARSDPIGDPRLIERESEHQSNRRLAAQVDTDEADPGNRSPTPPPRLSGGDEGLRTSGAALGDKSAQPCSGDLTPAIPAAEVRAMKPGSAPATDEKSNLPREGE